MYSRIYDDIEKQRSDVEESRRFEEMVRKLVQEKTGRKRK